MIREFQMDEIWPLFLLNDRNGRAMAKAIKAGLDYYITKCREGVGWVLDVDSMPEWRLDEMAWETDCIYDYSAEANVKREWIRNAIPLYSIWGTPQSVKEFLKGYFGEIEIQEWWEYGGEPYHFRVTVGGEWNPRNEKWARDAIERAKNVRSVMDDIRIGTTVNMAIEARGEAGEKIKYPFAGEIEAGTYPETNQIWIIDRTPAEAKMAEEYYESIYYRMCGEGECGE